MISIIKTVAEAAGADVIIYDQPSMQNVLADDVSGTTIALIDEINEVSIGISNNGVNESVALRIAFTRQAEHLDTAELNKTDTDAMLVMCRKFMMGLVRSGIFRALPAGVVVKFQENVMDRTLIGWQLQINLPLLDGYAEC